ncbi:MAG: acyltransferase family protein, partial [Terracidiphilus sp.]
FGTALLIAVPTSWINRRTLSFRPLVFIGRISYSWYLWHWPMLSFLRIIYGDAPPGPIAVAAIAVSFVLAIVSYYAIEQPFRRSSRAAVPLLARYAVATALAVAVSAALWHTHGAPQRFPALAQIESQAARLKSDPCIADIGDDGPNVSTACIQKPAPPQVAQVALWGDSHAAALAPAARTLAASQGYGFAEFAKASCPPILGAAQFLPHHPSLAANCLAYNRRVFDRLLHDSRVSVVIFTASWAGYLHRDWQHGWLVTDPARASTMPSDQTVRLTLAYSISGTVRTLRAAGKQVYVFEDIPAFDFEPMWRLDSSSIPARRSLASALNISNAADTGMAAPGDVEMAGAASALLEQALASQPSITLINLRSAFCSAGALCPYRIGDQLLYADNNHLSPAGARYALREFHLPPASTVIAEREPAP